MLGLSLTNLENLPCASLCITISPPPGLNGPWRGNSVPSVGDDTVGSVAVSGNTSAADDDAVVALGLTGVGADDDPTAGGDVSVNSSIPGNPSDLGLGFLFA